jgi:hypothetical protein
MPLGPVRVTDVIGVINKTCGIEALQAGEPTDAIVTTDKTNATDNVDGSGDHPTTGGLDRSEPSMRRAGLDGISRVMRARGAMGGARGRDVLALSREGRRDLSARKAHRGTVKSVITRGVGSCL